MRAVRPNPRRQALLEARARSMRFDATPSEAALWAAIRGKRLGSSFAARLSSGRTSWTSRKLVVDIDGGYHARRFRADQRRDEALRLAGYTVVRLPAELVLRALPEAVAIVRAAVEALR